ncbi:VanZ family protein [Streptomyces sp. NPDC015220]|uniref:VanZ family protein n=1 Tax=Streptomyces sp. NPDC015220 TaxID=3364947 RepID=UPI0037033222
MARLALRPRDAARPRRRFRPGGGFRLGGVLRRGGAPGEGGVFRRGGVYGGRTGKVRRAGAPAGGGRPDGGERRPAPWPLRLLAMVCAFVFMVAFAVVLARLTLEPSPASASLAHTNLRPGRSLREYLDQPELRDAVKQIGGNLLLGVPFGVLVPVVAPRARGLLRVLLLTATVMLLVEFAQGALITGRAFDVDDVILNTAGALVGYLLLGRRMGRAVHARRQH